jgi:hypothetical protein
MPRTKLRIVLAIIMLLLAGLVLYEYGFFDMQATASAVSEEKTVKKRTLVRYQTLIAQKPSLDKELEETKKQRKAEQRKMVEGQTPVLAAAAMQETLKGIIVGRGGKIMSDRVDKPGEFGKYSTLVVSLDFSAPDARALSDMVFAIETRVPYLAIKELDVRPRSLKDPKELAVKMDVTALFGGK